MKNLTGTLIELTLNSTTIQGNTNDVYASWSSAQIDSVCQAIKDLLVNNVSALVAASSATNNYLLTSNVLESGYAIRVHGSVGSSTVASFVEIAEGTWDGSTFESKLSYKIYPFISALLSSSSNTYYAIGIITWSFSYVYRMIVDDTSTNFVLRLAPDVVPDNPFTYATGTYAYKRLLARNTASGRSAQIMKADVSNAPVIIAMLSINNIGRLVIMEQLYQNEGKLGAWIFGKGLAGNSWVSNGDWSGRSESSILTPLYGWRMYDRDYYIAATIYPSTQSSDYGSIKIVKLGCCEYGFPYIVDNTYLDNLFACERNSNIVDNQIIVIDGDKYLYSDSGYLFKLGPAVSGQTVTFSVYAGADDVSSGAARFKFDSAPSSDDDYDFYVAGGYSGDQPSVYGTIVPGGSESGVADGSQFTGSGQTLYCWGSDIYTTVTVGGTAISLGSYSNPTVIQLSGATVISVTPANFED